MDFISKAPQSSISISGVDIPTLQLQKLRASIAIIPQDPFLFSGTLRSNLDPQNGKSDAELKSALQHVHLSECPSDSPSQDRLLSKAGKFEDLDISIHQSGVNVSQGQQQLIYLISAILSGQALLIISGRGHERTGQGHRHSNPTNHPDWVCRLHLCRHRPSPVDL